MLRTGGLLQNGRLEFQGRSESEHGGIHKVRAPGKRSRGICAAPARMIDVPKAWLQVVVQVDGGLTILRMRVEAKLNFRGCYAAKALVPADCPPSLPANRTLVLRLAGSHDFASPTVSATRAPR